jgi:hypothetical protein
MVLCLAVILGLAVPVVTWRDPADGRPLPRIVAITIPILAGGLCYGIGSVILRALGLPVLAKPKKGSSDRAEDADGPPSEGQARG